MKLQFKIVGKAMRMVASRGQLNNFQTEAFMGMVLLYGARLCTQTDL